MTTRKTTTQDKDKAKSKTAAKSNIKAPASIRKASAATATASAPALRQDAVEYQVTPMAGRARSAAMAAIHSAAADLHDAGAIDHLTMRHFDRACLSELAIGPDDVRAIRQANRVSQSVFARLLGTSGSTVKQWESGAKQPSGMARTLLNAVRKHGLEVLS